MYLCVEFPPRPVSQEQILSHVTLDDGDSNSADRRGISIHYFFSLLCSSSARGTILCRGRRRGVIKSIQDTAYQISLTTTNKYLTGLKI